MGHHIPKVESCLWNNCYLPRTQVHNNCWVLGSKYLNSFFSCISTRSCLLVWKIMPVACFVFASSYTLHFINNTKTAFSEIPSPHIKARFAYYAAQKKIRWWFSMLFFAPSFSSMWVLATEPKFWKGLIFQLVKLHCFIVFWMEPDFIFWVKIRI